MFIGLEENYKLDSGQRKKGSQTKQLVIFSFKFILAIVIQAYIRLNSNLNFFYLQPQLFITQLHFKSPLATWRLPSFSLGIAFQVELLMTTSAI